ncbi:cupin [Rhodococcus sp. HNM0569]|uniref:cupin n=1 Tax=Rhodococcus sp. HNM0569 TaxID=2716340 RepID=UPI00146D9761|nr:cupin [Rhodococcus sp. HNM0569]NLU84825.1 cupin [Rhodococcus sp. HNM0569]
MSDLTFVDGLDVLDPTDGDGPHIQRLAAGSGVTVVRLGFTAGQVMDRHRARVPIMVQGVVGRVEFSTASSTQTLVPGTAVLVDAEVEHRLEATADSVLTLLVLR